MDNPPACFFTCHKVPTVRSLRAEILPICRRKDYSDRLKPT